MFVILFPDNFPVSPSIMELFNIFPVPKSSTLLPDIVKLFIISLPDSLTRPEPIVFPLFVIFPIILFEVAMEVEESLLASANE